MNSEQLRKEFPIFGSKVYGKDLVYFDNAATSQRPETVVNMQRDMALYHNANIHRAVHALSVQATAAYEEARDAARDFLSAEHREEIIFTSGATAAINLVAYSFGQKYIGKGDEIVLGVAEHHSNFVPWQQLAMRCGAKVRYLYPSECGAYRVDDLRALLSGSTKIACFAHASNVLGIVNPVKEMAAACHELGIPVMVDGAQGAAHIKVNVQDLDCDFYAFSAHKIFGPTGTGVLYGKKKWLEEMPPFLCGGEMVGTVSTEGTTFAQLPMKFEAGTQNFNAAAALVPALKFASNILSDDELNEELESNKEYLYNALLNFDGLHLYGRADGDDMISKLPVFSFTIEGVHHEDLALLLDKMGIAVRSGQMCAEPLMTLCGVTGMLRVSLLQYNTRAEAEYFMKCLEKAVKMLK